MFDALHVSALLDCSVTPIDDRDLWFSWDWSSTRLAKSKRWYPPGDLHRVLLFRMSNLQGSIINRRAGKP